MEDRKIMCRICLKSSVFCKIVDSTYHIPLFIQITGLQICDEKLYLCIWCKATLNRTIDLIKLATETQSFLTLHYEPNHESLEPKKSLYSLENCINAPINILSAEFIKHSHNIPDEIPSDVKVECEENFIDAPIDILSTELIMHSDNILDPNEIESDVKKLYEESTSEINYQDPLDANNQVPNIPPVKKENLNAQDVPVEKPVEKLKIKPMKKVCMYEEYKFDIRHLNVGEQLKAVEKRKDNNRNMNFLCQLCGNGFTTEHLFELHNEKHCDLAGPHKCKICHQYFRTRPTLTQHSLLHSRVFQCRICRTNFNKWGPWTVSHRQKCGTELRPSTCRYCSKIFNTTYSLGVHVKIVHEAGKKYTCGNCERVFANKQRLEVHMRSHTGHRPFSCAHCERKFTTNSNLSAHLSVHSDATEFYCVECNISYKTAKSLKRHFDKSPRHVVPDRNPCNPSKQSKKIKANTEMSPMEMD